ncbi:MAG: hypothetical protein EA392_11785 [Cryomorphaceae bacterium]|nr:MAG: hypothetical protein EA392_11785 [Cryomorphaceae bacterium]
MDISAKKLVLIEWLLKLQDERLLGKIEKIKEQSDFWNELTADEQAKIEDGIKDLDAGRKTPYESIIAAHRRK